MLNWLWFHSGNCLLDHNKRLMIFVFFWKDLKIDNFFPFSLSSFFLWVDKIIVKTPQIVQQKRFFLSIFTRKIQRHRKGDLLCRKISYNILKFILTFLYLFLTPVPVRFKMFNGFWCWCCYGKSFTQNYVGGKEQKICCKRLLFDKIAWEKFEVFYYFIKRAHFAAE